MPTVTDAERLETIKKYSETKGVTILLEWDEDSYAVKTDSLYNYEPKDKILSINFHALASLNKPFLLELIRKVHEDGGLLWKKTKEEPLRRYIEFTKSGSDAEILEFFSSIISYNDLIALKLSLFIRSEARAGRSVQQYKEDIRFRFGERGNVIANLCNANYFEKEFMPLYMQMLHLDFVDYFEKVVGEEIRALFVHSGMSIKDISDEVEKMVSKAIKYRMDDFKIHGIGKSNIENLKKYISGLEEDEDRFKIKQIYFNPKIPVIEYVVQILNKD
jgi:hypothetical protein